MMFPFFSHNDDDVGTCEPSWPNTAPGLHGSKPAAHEISVWQTPVASISTRTSSDWISLSWIS